jgi:hypothetical protein
MLFGVELERSTNHCRISDPAHDDRPKRTADQKQSQNLAAHFFFRAHVSHGYAPGLSLNSDGYPNKRGGLYMQVTFARRRILVDFAHFLRH